MNDDCTLIDGYAVLVQFFVGVLAISTLLLKRKHEWPQRPWRVWLFDTSKQALSSAAMHVVNVLAAYIVDRRSDDSEPDQCVWYLTSILIDGTLLLTIMATLVTLWSWFVEFQDLPSLRQGEYGSPPAWELWVQQLTVYSLFLFAAKAICLFVFYKHSHWYKSLAILLVSPIVEHRRVELVTVLVGIPGCLATLQYWLMDSLLKANWRVMWIRRVSVGWQLVPSPPSDDAGQSESEQRQAQNLLRTQGVAYYVLGSVDHFHVDAALEES